MKKSCAGMLEPDDMLVLSVLLLEMPYIPQIASTLFFVAMKRELKTTAPFSRPNLLDGVAMVVS